MEIKYSEVIQLNIVFLSKHFGIWYKVDKHQAYALL